MEPVDYSKYVVNYKKRGNTSDEVFYKPSTITTLDITTIPTATSLKDKIPFIFDQGPLGSCVSNAISLCISYLNNDFIPSRLFIYYNGRILGSLDINQDTGLTVYDACISVKQFTPCQESLWPYIISSFTIKPSQQCYDTPITLNDFSFMAVTQDMQHIRSCINDGLPIIFAILLYTSFYNANKTGNVVMPNTSTEECKGGHCILMVGYDDSTQLVTCVNSWGNKWGNNGFFTLPYSYILDNNLAHDFYIIKFSNLNINVKPKNNIFNNCCIPLPTAAAAITTNCNIS